MLELIRLGPGADAYDLALDAERGIVLREAASLDGAEYAVTEMLEVAFDESFPPETFAPPTSDVPRRARRSVESEELSFEDAARRAPFGSGGRRPSARAGSRARPTSRVTSSTRRRS